MRVVFLGNHNVGLEAMYAIQEIAELVGVVAHPEDPEDGICYKSVYDYAVSMNITAIRATGRNKTTFKFIEDLKPDLLWVTDYRYLIPDTIIQIAPMGAINLHPSLLPKYRGRASINWAIINKEREVGLTAHFIDGGVDTGDIIEQIRIEIDEDTYIGDLLERYYPIYRQITQKTLENIQSGNPLILKKQYDSSMYPIYPKRTTKDGLIDWNKSIEEIYALIRAVSKPYPGAYTFYEGKKIIIWQAIKLNLLNVSLITVGSIVEVNGNLIVKCIDGYLEIKEYELV
jgi:methionyl-tRNA formyltransferase